MKTPLASPATPLLVALLLVAMPSSLLARSSDRNQPMDVLAANIKHALNESEPTVLQGNVAVTQGTLDIRASRAEVTTRNDDPSRVVLTGSPARLKQEMDDGSPFSADASRIDYDLTTDVVTLTGNVVVKQRGNTMNGPRVVYDMKTGRVQASGSETDGGRVRMRLMPKTTAPATEPEGG